LLQLLDPLMSSDSAALNQVKSEMEILIDILNMKPGKFNTGSTEISKLSDGIELNKTTNRLFTQMLNFSKRLSNHLGIESYRSLNDSFSEFYIQWINYNKYAKFDASIVINNLELISRIISEDITKNAGKYLSDIQKLNIQCKVK